MTFDSKAVFKEEFWKAIAAEQESTGFKVGEWFRTGKRDVAEDIASWEENGPVQVDNFITWYEANPDINVWTTPDGVPAIELEVKVMFGSIPVRMFIDSVFECGPALIVCDLKSGAKTPANMRQLALYAGGLELAYGRRPDYGTFFMGRGVKKRGSDELIYFQRPIPMSGYQYSVGYLTNELEIFDRAVKGGTFLANPGASCSRCGVSYACPEVAGKEALKVLAERRTH